MTYFKKKKTVKKQSIEGKQRINFASSTVYKKKTIYGIVFFCHLGIVNMKSSWNANFFMQTITVFATYFMYCLSHDIVYKEEANDGMVLTIAKKELSFKKNSIYTNDNTS